MTIQQLMPRFNAPVTTPDGPGYLVARDDDGLLLVSVIQERRKASKGDPGASCCRHAWYKPDDIVEGHHVRTEVAIPASD